MYNLYNAEAQFKNYLIAGNISLVSVRNYLSDFRYFYGWYQNIYRGDSFLDDLRNSTGLLIQYKSFLTQSNSAISTIKRRLSSLQKFNLFLEQEGIIDHVTNSNSKVNSFVSDNNRSFNVPETSILDRFKYDLLLNTGTTLEVDAIINSVTELFTNNEAK